MFLDVRNIQGGALLQTLAGTMEAVHQTPQRSFVYTTVRPRSRSRGPGIPHTRENKLQIQGSGPSLELQKLNFCTTGEIFHCWHESPK